MRKHAMDGENLTIQPGTVYALSMVANSTRLMI